MPFGDRDCHNIKVIDNNNTIIISLMRTQEEQQKNRAKVAYAHPLVIMMLYFSTGMDIRYLYSLSSGENST
jgi:hypothetical protein